MTVEDDVMPTQRTAPYHKLQTFRFCNNGSFRTFRGKCVHLHRIKIMSLSLLATPTLALAMRAPVIRMQAEAAVEAPPPPPLPLIKVRLARRAHLPRTARAPVWLVV